MGIKTIRVCDSTGENLISPFYIGFTTENGDTVKFEVNKEVATQFVIALANRLEPSVLREIVEDFFGKDAFN
jgi:hypothetical protein